MTHGTATRVRLNGSPATDLASEILELGSHEALVLGDLADGLPDEIKLEKDGVADPARGTHGRTRRTFTYRGNQPAAALLDFDQKAMPADVRQRLDDVGGFRRRTGPADTRLRNAGPRRPPVNFVRPLQRRDRRALSRQRRAARLCFRERRRGHPALPRDPAKARMAGRLRLDHGRRPRGTPGPQHRRHQRRTARTAGVRRSAAGRGSAWPRITLHDSR